MVIGDDFVVDEAASRRLRGRMKGGKRRLALFDRGGDIETLRRRCVAETGLPAPRAPEFQTWVTAATARSGARRNSRR